MRPYPLDDFACGLRSLTSAGSWREKEAVVSLGNLDTRIPAPCPRLRSRLDCSYRRDEGVPPAEWIPFARGRRCDLLCTGCCLFRLSSISCQSMPSNQSPNTNFLFHICYFKLM
ncbi:unnamed protein product [Urochloa humidicola]